MDLKLYKKRIAAFVIKTWGMQALDNRPERAARVLEEALELAQAEGVEMETVVNIYKRVYSRPVGVPAEEAGDVFFTLLAWSFTAIEDLEVCLLRRLKRVEVIPVEELRQRHKDKRAAGTILYDEE